MPQTESDNSGLYFIVGGLVVLALIFAFIYMSNGELATDGPDRIIERSSETRIVPGENETNTTNYNFEAPGNDTQNTPPAGQ